MRLHLLLCGLFFTTLSWSQTAVNGFVFDEYTDIPVLKGNDSLTNAWAGGLNFPHFSTMDLDNDGVEDLLVFDRTGQRIIPFLNTGTAGSPKYRYAPKYRHSFPQGSGFFLLRDYNCDGKKDIFTSQSGALIVYENVTTGELPSFQKAHSTAYLEGLKPSSNTYTSVSMVGGDIPGIIDVDNDGDLDILLFLTFDNSVSWIENTQNCGLQYVFREKCWGYFSESGVTNEILLNSCTASSFKKEGVMHSGSAVLPLDLNGDGVKEILISDVSYPNINALFNTGTLDSAYMSSKDENFPTYDQSVNLPQFPSMFYEDVDGDQVKDLLVSTNEYDNNTGFVSQNNIWMYKNKGSNGSPTFERMETNFLRKTQIDVGEGAVPRIVDLNSDGLNDIVLANGFYRKSLNSQEESFLYLQNTGTVAQPEFSVIDTNFANIGSYGLGSNLIPTFGDLDQDNDQDMIVGDGNGKLHFFTNTGTMQNPSFTLTTPAINGIDVGRNASPFLADMDDDGDLDLVVGKLDGTLSYFENQSATSPSFTLKSDFLGGIDVTEISNGYSIPYLFRYNGFLNLMVSGEKGVYQYDSIQSVTSRPASLDGNIGSGTTASSNSDETPFGTNKRSGRNRILFLASELKDAGLTSGKITGLSFKVTNYNNLIEHLSMSMQNVSFTDVNDFDASMENVIYDERQAFQVGWTEIPLESSFTWDGYSNLLIEICFRGNYVSTSNFPNIEVEMSTTQHNSNAYGDITDFNTLQKNGCVMPYLQTSKERPNVKIHLTPTFPRTSIVMSDGYRNAAAFGDLDQDGFIDALLGNYSGGITLYKGRQYVISEPEKEVADRSFQVYPNPGEGAFSIALQNTGKAMLQVFDLTGRLVLKEELTQAESLIDISSEPNGMYIFMLQHNAELKTQKVILQR